MRVHPALGLGLAVVIAWTGTCAWGPVGPGRLHRLVTRDLAFLPERAHVALGDTVAWANHDLVPHTVTAADGRWDSGDLTPGTEFRLPIEGPGTIHYVCRYHPTMTGVLVVQ